MSWGYVGIHVHVESLCSCRKLKTIVYVKSVKDIKSAELSFPFPDSRPKWRSKPEHIITSVLGHEGPGSVFSYLKSKGWITSLSAGVSTMAHEIAVMKLTVKLTDKGFSECLIPSEYFYAYHEWFKNTIAKLSSQYSRVLTSIAPRLHQTHSTLKYKKLMESSSDLARSIRQTHTLNS